MTTRELAVYLKDILNEYRLLEPSPLQAVDDVRTFDEAGLKLFNKGIVISMKDGTEFQVNIIASIYR